MLILLQNYFYTQVMLLPSLALVLLMYSGRSSRVGLKQEREKVAHQVASSRKRHTGVRRACAQTIP